MKKYEVVLIGIAVIFVIVLIMAIMHQASETTFDGHEWEVVVYCVEQGETLWNIGREECPYDVDIRDWIDNVLNLNGMENSRINEGQRILIYTLKE